MRRQLRLSIAALAALVVAVGGITPPAAAAQAAPASPYHVTVANSPKYWSAAAPDNLAMSITGTKVIDGGFTQTYPQPRYDWAVPLIEGQVSHSPSATPALSGFDINHFFEKPFMRAVFTFKGAMPSYRFQYVSRTEARGCTGANLRGSRFLRITFLPATNASSRPVGEVLLVEEGAVVTMALTCTLNTRAQFGFGTTALVGVRTGETTDFDPFEQVEIFLVALDFHD